MARVHEPLLSSALIDTYEGEGGLKYFGKLLPTVYFLGVRMDGSERAGAFSERNSKSISENGLTSLSYSFCTAPMQSKELEPVPIQAGLSVHWLPLATELIVTLLCGSLIAALDALLKNVETVARR